MKIDKKFIIEKGEWIDGKYEVIFPVKKGLYADTYRVKSKGGRTYFLKLIDKSRLQSGQLTRNGKINEIQFIAKFDHPNIVEFNDHGVVFVGERKYTYLVLKFISGETIAEKLQREEVFNEFEAVNIIKGVLKGLSHLHNLSEPIIHNDLNHHNVMLDLSGSISCPVIIDLGYARSFYKSVSEYNSVELNSFYMANECYNHLYSPQSDLFSAGALLFHMLFGLPPWFTEISPYQTSEKIRAKILNERKRPLKFPFVDGEHQAISDQTLNITKKALSSNLDIRFKSATEFLDAIEGKTEVVEPSNHKVSAYSKMEPSSTKIEDEHGGFDQVAGLGSLKETLKNDVIDALNNPEKYREYGLTIPNGLLLYGPPGCGKTFIAEKLAEEISFNFIFIKPSDLGSIYVHGGKGKIGELFKNARENAPSIIFLDEIDAFLPERDGGMNHNYSSEVNEFLAQMTNCSEKGVMVIGATNMPQKIDKAIMRRGRIDKVVYVPQPDKSARSKIFELELKGRPLGLGINYDKLGLNTKGFVASDIVFIVDEAARYALRNNQKIEQQTLEAMIIETRPSLPASEIKKYERIKAEFEGEGFEGNSKRIGF